MFWSNISFNEKAYDFQNYIYKYRSKCLKNNVKVSRHETSKKNVYYVY